MYESSDLLGKLLDWRPVENAVMAYKSEKGLPLNDTDFFLRSRSRRVRRSDERLEDPHSHEGQPVLPDSGGVAAEGAVGDDKHASRDPVVAHSRLQRAAAVLRCPAGGGVAERIHRRADEGDAHLSQQREHAQPVRARAAAEDASLQHPGGFLRDRAHRLAVLSPFSLRVT